MSMSSPNEFEHPSSHPPRSEHPDSSERHPDAQDTEAVRVGSPFVSGSAKATPPPLEPPAPLTADQIHEVGVLRYTAMGSVAAAILVAFFAAIAMFWFPVGGILIAALGCILSLFGLMSQFKKMATGLLVAHLAFFVLSYSVVLGI